MAKYDPNYKPTGDAAKAGVWPEDYVIVRGIRSTGIGAGPRRVYGPGDEEALKETKPSVAQIDAWVSGGHIRQPNPTEARQRAARLTEKAEATAAAKKTAKK
jgi:hypothetical protein